MKLEPTNSKTPDSKMTYGDYIIRFEHKFLRNIFTEKELHLAEHTASLQNYYEIFSKYIQICVGLIASLNGNRRDDFINNEIEEFVEEEFVGETLQVIKNTINKTEMFYKK